MTTPPAGDDPWVVGPLRTDDAGDRAAWDELYRGYGAFYETAMPQDKLDRVWAWLHDDAHELEGLCVRRRAGGPPIGLAHFRQFVRPLHGATGLFLDDMYVDPQARGGGAADRLLAELRAIAAARGLVVVRWLTQASNERARRLYDRVGRATGFVTYDMDPDIDPAAAPDAGSGR